MSSLYAASTLLLLSVPHAFAVPVAQNSATFEVSALTGGLLTLPFWKSLPAEPEVGEPTLPVPVKPTPLTFPIEPGIGDDSGPEAFGDKSTTPVISLPPSSPSASLAAPTPIIDPILVDPVPTPLVIPTPEPIDDDFFWPPKPISPPVPPPAPLPSGNVDEIVTAVLKEIVNALTGLLNPKFLPPPILATPDLESTTTTVIAPEVNDTTLPVKKAPLIKRSESVSPFPVLPSAEEQSTSKEDAEQAALSIPNNAAHVVKAPAHRPHDSTHGKKFVLSDAVHSRVAASMLEKPASNVFTTIYNALASILPPKEASKALRAAFNALSPSSQATVIQYLAQGSVRPELKLTKRFQAESAPITKRQSPAYIGRVRKFIRKWHTVGAAIANSDPRFLQGLLRVFDDPNIDPYVYSNIGRFPDMVRQFVLEYYVLARILVDSGVQAQDKEDLLRALFDTKDDSNPDFGGGSLTKRNMRHGLRRRQAEVTAFDEGAELDDMEKLGGERLTAITGGSGSLDPAGLGDSDIGNFGYKSDGAYSPYVKPHYKTGTDYKNPYTRPNYKPKYTPTYDIYSDYPSDYDDVDTDYADPYSQTPDYDGDYVSRVPRPSKAMAISSELNGCSSE